jgi:hypothetical protein
LMPTILSAVESRLNRAWVEPRSTLSLSSNRNSIAIRSRSDRDPPERHVRRRPETRSPRKSRTRPSAPAA